MDAIDFGNRAIDARFQIQANAKQFLRSLRTRPALTVAAYWRSVLGQAFNESDFKQPWKIWSSIS